MRDDPVVVALVTRARDGDHHAWNEIVDRYAPLVWSICNRYQLSRQDIDDVGQTVWLLLVEHLANLRQPAALPGWLATTTHRECLRVTRTGRRHGYLRPLDESQIPPDQLRSTIEEDIIAAELNAALRAAFAQLPDRCRRLLSLLLADPPLSYPEIGSSLAIAVGSIGPQRKRCLERLRRSLLLADTAISPDTGRASGTGGVPRA
jgi:RNA polymerase sigma factor (sigma-70 family)